ncbi:MAG: type II secretion system protein [Candidatus Omnitrophota bacterium]|nr:type II secretion system protein [Candidatus Omnitrophota bacterium]
MNIYKDNNKTSGYTLVELMIAVAIIGLLATMALPNVYRVRAGTRKSICVNNLRQIEAAVDRWVFENSVPEGIIATPSQEGEIYSYIRGGKPVCPGGGTYTIGAIGTYPQVSCSIEGHALAE